MRKFLLFLLLGLSCAGAQAANPERTVELHFFWSQLCPHCLQAQPFIETLAADNDWLQLHSHELSQSAANRLLYRDMAAALGEQARSVPAFIFCGRMLVGYESEATTGAWLNEQLRACRDDAGRSAAAPPLPQIGFAPPESLWLSTLVIAGLDAFNPCAFFVLLSLLGLLLHARERGRILLVGGLFVLISGLFYFLSMAAWLNLFLLAGQMAAITLAAGGLALLIGAINIKDYFLFKTGPSLTIPDRAKPGLFRRMRRLIDARRLPALVLGAGTLAVVANSYELLCTAGFPMVYTRLLTLEQLPATRYYAWLLLYNLIYVIPLAAMVVLSAYGLGRRQLSERGGRLLKLVSGVMMAGLGVTLLLNPGALALPGTGLVLLLLALACGLLAWRFEPRAAPR